MVPFGTAFIVSSDCVLTAYHCIGNDAGSQYYKDIVIARGLVQDKQGNNHIIEESFPVQYFRGSPKNDWAILQRTDGLKFDVSQIVPISTIVPNDKEEAEVKIYHCAVSLFLVKCHQATVAKGFNCLYHNP